MVRAEKQNPPTARSCELCTSGRQAEFPTEMIIHFFGLKNLDKPGVRVFSKLLVCLDCGFARFTTPEAALALLAAGTPTSEGSLGFCSVISDVIERGLARLHGSV